jgi:WD40 repeat protein
MSRLKSFRILIDQGEGVGGAPSKATEPLGSPWDESRKSFRFLIDHDRGAGSSKVHPNDCATISQIPTVWQRLSVVPLKRDCASSLTTTRHSATPAHEACAGDPGSRAGLFSSVPSGLKRSSLLTLLRASASPWWIFFCLVLALVSAAAAQGTRQWKETGYEDFERGTAHGVAIRNTGQLELAPAFKPVYTSPSTFIWSIASDKDGTVYAATGAPARVYRVTPDGQATVIFEPKELQVQAIALGKDGAVYAATSPDGKVYRITRAAAKTGTANAADFSAAVFFDPKTKYIWDLAFDTEGRLYVATGDSGEIYRVDKNGQGSVFFKSDEAHIRVLGFDPKGNLIAGSDGSGLVYRISPAGEGFVLYSAPRKEITALAVDAAGNIYAAGTGEKRATQPSNPLVPQPAAIPLPPGGPATGIPFMGTVNLGGSDIFMIAPDGSPKKLWSSREDIVYALAFDSAGRLIAGTGNKGRIFAIEKNGDFTDLLKASATQVTAFSKAAGGGLYCSSSTLGKIFLMGNTPETEVSFESDVQDVKIFSRWGRAEVRGHGNFELFTRSGNVDNPDRNWSAWSRIDPNKDNHLEIPAARFIQWRAVLKPANPSTQVDEVVVNYLSKNVAPVVDEIVVQAGARFQPQPHVPTPDTITINMGPVQPQAAAPHVELPLNATKDRSYIAVRWNAHDENDDNLVFSVYYRGENEREWKLLKSGLTDKFYSFDSGLLPDGGYVVKVVASDAPSHTPEEALAGEKETQLFDVDNTPPRIENLAARVEGQQIHVTFRATDDYSPIKRAEYSVDAGEWQYLEPVDKISDSKTEAYDFNVLLATLQPPPEDQAEPRRVRGKANAASRSEHVVVVRVYDRYDNVAAAKYVVR